MWGGVLLALALAAGCGSDSTDDDAAGDSTSADASTTVETSAAASASTVDDAATFPVTVSHVFGETVIESEPSRVVVVGLNEADYLYSLGIAPVGVHEWWGAYPFATGPWADPVREELGAEPAVLEEWEVDVEWVAALEPDLIVATYHDIDQAMYDLLSKVAPVVAQPPEYDNWSTPWREQLRQIAMAVGRSERADAVIADIDELIEQTVSQHPSLEGKTFNTGSFAEAGGFTVYSSADVANQSLAELGMDVPAEHDANADGVFVEISDERLELLDVLDVLIFLDDTGETRAKLAAHPTFPGTRVSQEERVVVPEFDVMVAMSFNTPLSIPYYLAELAPMLDAAADGDPATDPNG
jgi:iron complex transport system substrate-binding protein